MKKGGILFLLLAFMFQHNAVAQQFSFQPGENIQYTVSFSLGFISMKAAQANLTVNNCQYEGKDALKLELAAKTIKAFKSFNIRDTLRAVADAQTLETYFAQQQTHEDNYYSSVQTQFSHEGGKVKAEVKKFKRDGLKRDTTMYFDKGYYDVISILYNIRNIDASKLVKGQKYPMPFLFAFDKYDLYWRYIGKEKIKLKNGETYNCLKVCPYMTEGSLFGKGEVMTIWLTDDENHIPVLIESKLKVGSIKAYAENIKGNKYPLTSLVSKK
ncbi:MAG: DUF3108 domain-containing protein [Bacteroidales bacterium]|nr:DUF3108 domain-containing protein [Bacteroidales bacterium]